MNSRIEDNAAAAATVLNLANGGTVSVQDSVLQKGARSTAASTVRFGGGGSVYANSALSLTRNVLVTDKPGALLVQNTTTAAATVLSNQLWGFTGAAVNTGLASLSGNTAVAARPAVSTATVITYNTGSPSLYGRAGAVVANGTVLTVGPRGTYATLNAALLAAHDGDTVAVTAGTYAVAPIAITHKVIIEGVGGLASLTAARGTTAAALITATADLTLRNVEISGLAGPEAAVSDVGGHLTLVNSTIHNNGTGILATGATATLGIYDTELARNGTPDGQGANVRAAGIDTLALNNAYVHDALAGPEVSSAAAYTIIDASRISQAVGNGAADLLLLGGQTTVTNSAIEKSATAQATPLIQLGNLAAPAGSSLTVSGTTLISDQVAGPTAFVSGNAAITATLTNDTFVGGTAGSVQGPAGSVSGAIVGTGISVNTASPWSRGVAANGGAAPVMVAPTVPVSTAMAAQRGVLVLDMSGTEYHGNAQFQVLVDGTVVGGTLTAMASHTAGQSQAFTVGGTYAPGPHTVQVQFLNALAGSGGTARTLSLDGAQFNGAPLGHATTLSANGMVTMTTDTVAAAPTPVTVNLSEDAWHGDAQALITIDGKVQNGVQVVTASHAQGITAPMRFLPMLTAGPHTLGVTFLNHASSPAGDRTLYVDSIDIAGQHYASAAASLLTGGTSTFAFTVAPLPANANVNLFVTAGTPKAVSMIVPLP